LMSQFSWICAKPADNYIELTTSLQVYPHQRIASLQGPKASSSSDRYSRLVLSSSFPKRRCSICSIACLTRNTRPRLPRSYTDGSGDSERAVRPGCFQETVNGLTWSRGALKTADLRTTDFFLRRT
jgi:hypothetical protein